MLLYGTLKANLNLRAKDHDDKFSETRNYVKTRSKKEPDLNPHISI